MGFLEEYNNTKSEYETSLNKPAVEDVTNKYDFGIDLGDAEAVYKLGVQLNRDGKMEELASLSNQAQEYNEKHGTEKVKEEITADEEVLA